MCLHIGRFVVKVTKDSAVGVLGTLEKIVLNRHSELIAKSKSKIMLPWEPVPSGNKRKFEQQKKAYWILRVWTKKKLSLCSTWSNRFYSWIIKDYNFRHSWPTKLERKPDYTENVCINKTKGRVFLCLPGKAVQCVWYFNYIKMISFLHSCCIQIILSELQSLSETYFLRILE